MARLWEMRAASSFLIFAVERGSPGGRSLVSTVSWCSGLLKMSLKRTLDHVLNSLGVVFAKVDNSCGGFLERVAARSVEETRA